MGTETLVEQVFAALHDLPERASQLDALTDLVYGPCSAGWRVVSARRAVVSWALNKLARAGRAKYKVRVVGGVPCTYWWRALDGQTGGEGGSQSDE